MFRKLIRKLLRLLSKHEIKERQYAIGINSFINILKDRHMLFLDYDRELNFKEALDDCEELCNFFNLSDYEIFSTGGGGYHIFWWYDNNLPYSRVKMIIDYSRCDNMYKYISRFYDHKTIRATGKYIKNKYNDLKYVGKFSGKRTPTAEQRNLGELKRKEYLLLKEQNFFIEKVLK